MRKVLSVYVRNNGDAPFSDRYDGEDFTIAPGQVLEMEADCARLVFGVGEQDKTRAIRRLGWAPTANDMKDALARLFSFSFFSTPEEAAANTSQPQPERGEDQRARPSAPAGGRTAAGGASGPPAAVGQEGGQIDNVRPRGDERRPTNVLENIARVAANAAS